MKYEVGWRIRRIGGKVSGTISKIGSEGTIEKVVGNIYGNKELSIKWDDPVGSTENWADWWIGEDRALEIFAPMPNEWLDRYELI